MADQPISIFEIKEYMVIFRQLEVEEVRGVRAYIRAIVRCSGVGLQDDTPHRLDVHFLAPQSDYPEPLIDLDSETRTGRIFMPMTDMLAFVDILRNEKPLYGHLRLDHPQWTGMTTTNEPVGAGDEDFDPAN